MTTTQRKNLPIWKIGSSLRGLAILAVIVNHAAFFGVTYYRFAMGQEVPVFGLPFGLPWKMATPGWLAIQEITRFSVPLFILLIGNHVANFGKTWKSVEPQLKKFMIPFILWSFLGWGLSLIWESPGWSVGAFLGKFISGSVFPGHYFFILLLQFYLFSPWVTPWVKKHPVLSLTGSFIIQFSWQAVDYLALAVQGKLVQLPIAIGSLPEYLFPRFSFFYVLGILLAAYPDAFTGFFSRFRTAIFIAAGVSLALLIGEHGAICNMTVKQDEAVEFWMVWTATEQWKLTTSLFSLTAICSLLILGKEGVFSKPWLDKLGANSFVIFLLNGPLMYAGTKVLNLLKVPESLQFLSFAGLVLLALVVPLVLLRFVKKGKATLYVLGY